MAVQFHIRVGVRAQLYFTLAAIQANLSERELLALVQGKLKKFGNDERGFLTQELPNGAVYPEYNTVDHELSPDRTLDLDKIRVFDIVKIEA
jgi:hypothetical protein